MSYTDLATALSLLAVDRSLQGICLWGPRAPETDEYVRTFLKQRSGGQLVRLPASVSPGDVYLTVPRTERSGVNGSPASDALYRLHFLNVGAGLLARARKGVLLIESADLIAHASAAALRRALARMPALERPLLMLRSDLHPSEWPLLAEECAFWVQEYEPSPDGTPYAAAADPPGDDNKTRPPLFDEEQMSGAIKRLPLVEYESALLHDTLTKVPLFQQNSHGVDRFVARTAVALAALAGRRSVDERLIQQALRLVVSPRISPDERTDKSTNGTASGSETASTTNKQRTGGEQRETGAQSTTAAPSAGSRSTTDDHGSSPAPTSRRRQHEGARTDSRRHERTIVVPPAELFAALSLDTEPKHARAHRPRLHPPRRPPGHTAGPATGTVTTYRPGRPLSIAATVHAALPWQRLRDTGATDDGPLGTGVESPATHPPRRLRVLPQDLRGRPRRPRPKTLYVLVVDGSGSMARGRMELAKSAALSVLNGAYKERRYVALVDFRGTEATLLCPPGRSSAAIRRLITGLPSGGGTPLPAALRLARDVSMRWLQNNVYGTVRIVLFTDGEANVPLSPANAPADDGVSAALSRRHAVRDDVRRLAQSMNTLPLKFDVVHSDGWRQSPQLLDIAQLLDATIVRPRRGIGAV